MRIRIEDLPTEGLDVAFGIQDGWAVQAAREALEGEIEALEGAFHVMKVGPGVQVQGRAKARVIRACDRCLASVCLAVGGTVSLYYSEYVAPPDADTPLHADDLDVGFYDGIELDLAASVAEFLALEAPQRLFCGDRGVRRLEEGVCDLPAVEEETGDSADPRLAALRNVKFEA